MDRTPDIRTRSVCPQWAATVVIHYADPLIKPGVIARLLAGAGLLAGVGDFRPEKGKGTFGQFDVVDKTDKRFQALVKGAGREVQERALVNAETYNAESENLLRWFESEAAKREMKFTPAGQVAA